MKQSACLLLTCLSVCGVTMAQPELPIDSLYLYKNGMAYVIRNGEFDQPLTLSFNRDDLNDILKNLIAYNPETGVPYPLGYSTAIPGERLLQRFPFDLSRGGLAAFLYQVKGAGVKVSAANRSFTGKVVGIESARISGDRPPQVVEDHRLTLLAGDGQLRNFLLSDIDTLRFEDSQLNRQLTDYLQIVRETAGQTGADVTIRPIPQGGPIRVAYVQQFPVWKTSYRLALGEPDRLQGWVQIDNPTGEAWEGVELTLVSGSPVSFVMDLYPPLYTTRKTVAVPNRQAAAPVAYEQTVQSELDAAESVAQPSRKALSAARQRLPMAAPEEAFAGAIPPPPPLQVEEAEATRVEDYFEYRFPFPITLQHRDSALLPFLNRELETEKVAVFNAANHPTHPYNSIRLENSTGVPLEPGPVTVFQEDRYAGEAVLDYLNRGETGLISYGLDYETAVTRRTLTQPEEVVRLVIGSGVARFFKESLKTTRYLLKSNAERSKSVVIEHPYSPALKLKSPDPRETTPSFYRFQVELQPRQELEVPVQEIVSSQSSLALRQLDHNRFLVFFSNLNLPASLRAQLDEIIEATTELNQLHLRRSQLEQQYDTVNTDQKRIRENLTALGKSAGEKQLSERYIRQLQSQEDDLDRLKQEREQLERQIDQKETALNQLIGQLSFDGDMQ